jgi:hypothetical protein
MIRKMSEPKYFAVISSLGQDDEEYLIYTETTVVKR